MGFSCSLGDMLEETLPQEIPLSMPVFVARNLKRTLRFSSLVGKGEGILRYCPLRAGHSPPPGQGTFWRPPLCSPPHPLLLGCAERGSHGGRLGCLWGPKLVLEAGGMGGRTLSEASPPGFESSDAPSADYVASQGLNIICEMGLISDT